MNLITRSEVTDLTDAELSALFARILWELSQAKPGTVEYQGAMISLDNIRGEQAKRRMTVRPKGPGF